MLVCMDLSGLRRMSHELRARPALQDFRGELRVEAKPSFSGQAVHFAARDTAVREARGRPRWAAQDLAACPGIWQRLWCQRLRLNVSSQVRRSHFRLLNSVLLFTKTRSRRPRAAEAREAAARRGWPASGTEGCFRADSNSLTAHRLLEVKRH